MYIYYRQPVHAGTLATHTHTHTHIHTYIHTYIHTNIHTYIRTYIHTYLHTFVHTYMHSYRHIPYSADTFSFQIYRANDFLLDLHACIQTYILLCKCIATSVNFHIPFHSISALRDVVKRHVHIVYIHI